MEFTGERLILGACDPELEMEHLTRYYFAAQYVENKRVVDVACGTGYGSGILGQAAVAVVGIDIDTETIEFANRTYASEKVRFLCSPAEQLPTDLGEVDVAVSFETIEHLSAEMQHYFLSGIKRILSKDGLFIVSTPNKKLNVERGENHYHLHELELSSFRMLLESHFHSVRILPQVYEVCNTISLEGQTTGTIVNAANMDVAEYFVAVCSQSKLPAIQPISWVRTDGKYKQILQWAITNHNTIMSNNDVIVKQQKENEENSQKIRDIWEERECFRLNLEQLEQKFETQEQQHLVLQQAHTALQQAHTALQQAHTALQQEHTALQQEHTALQQEHTALQREHTALQQEHTALQREHTALQREHTALQQERTALQREHTALQQEHTTLQQECLVSTQNRDALQSKLIAIRQELHNKEGHIELLLESDRELARVHNSKSWMLMKSIWKVTSWIAPVGSKRRLILKLTYKAVRHPIRFFRNLTPYNIKTFFKVLKREGVAGVSRRIDNVMRGKDIPPQLVTVTQVDTNMAAERQIADYAKLVVPQFAEPVVSIVIPVYNQFDYTYHCIRSIVANSGEIAYEIIVANDCSTDLTVQLCETIAGVHMVTNTENLRFLKNCNNAAQYAKGSYILFLNNDTQVQENWLAPLVELTEKDATIGMVGSKLVYPNGQLQEAGGILWKDGSAWNYGHSAEPEAPEYNYVKEVDYISGAAIMIRKSLWNEIGGFDERFIPAYYEDTDLAFEVRKHGYRVVYQPLSTVVHFEGMSNGTDLSTGQKAYQQTNQKKFFEKWKDVLEHEHFANAEHVLLAKDRSKNKKVILVIDHYVPHFDKDAGGRCTFMYTQLFINMGMKVVFIGDNFFPHQPYTQVLQQMGVEVLYGNYYYNNIMTWIKENADSIDYAYLNRPHISEKYIDLLKTHTHAKIIYFGHDLHYLRELRQYEIEKDPVLLKSSENWKKREMLLFSKADVIFAVGSFEQETLQKEFPKKPVYNIPVYIYDSVNKKCNLDFAQRENILFVGGFGHPPNADAVLWFYHEIFPDILKEYADIKWYIVGSNPPQEILDLQSEHIVVTGFISDEELSQLYETCRIAVVPLRFGAGVKGKVVEAIYNRIPLITTPVGAEGLSSAEQAFVVVETAKEMTAAVCDLYGDISALQTIAHNCDCFIERHFTRKTAEDILCKEISLT